MKTNIRATYWLLTGLVVAMPGLAQLLETPALLSRGLPAVETRTNRDTAFQPYAGVFSGYDNGPFTTSLDRAGGPFQEVDGGIRVFRAGPRTEFTVDYRFDARHYTEASRLDRTNQALDLDLRFRLSRRLTVMLRDTGVSASYDNSLSPSPLSGLAAGFAADAGPNSVHARTIADTGMVDVVFSPSARTSLSIGGDGFLIERQFAALVDAVGWRARADIAHRYSRHRTVSLSYSFTHFSHTRSFGGADYVVVALGHSMRLGHNSELDLLAGVGRLQNAGLRAVALDPEISRLLGTSLGVEAFHLDTWSPHLMAAWLQGVGRAQLGVQFARQITDGGGLTGLARQNEGTLTLAPAHTRWSWRPATHLTVLTYRSLDTLLFSNTMASAGASVTNRLGPHTEAVFRYDFGFYNYSQGLLRNFQRHQVAVGVIYYLSPDARDR